MNNSASCVFSVSEMFPLYIMHEDVNQKANDCSHIVTYEKTSDVVEKYTVWIYRN